jgi:uncharacterized membrane protein YphA (DoxX/SURF4 family)
VYAASSPTYQQNPLILQEDIMSSTTVAPARRATRTGRIANVATWLVQVVLGFSLASGGALKLSGDPIMVDLFADIGAGQWLRYFVGAAEVAGGLGLLVAPLCGLAAVGLTALMAGAIVTNVAIIDENPTLPAVYLVVLAAVAWRRRARTAALVARFRRS